MTDVATPLQGKVVAPGHRLCPATAFEVGNGAYRRGDFIFASVVGTVRVRADADGVGESRKAAIDVLRNDKNKDTVIPKVGDIVIAKVVKITARFAKVEIAAVGSQTLRHTTFEGMIRKLDIRATEVDKLKMHECFRPGDLIKAQVISLGTARSYFLSTAKNELGVFHATSIAGFPLVPVSWQEMQCSGTGAKEPRKVAKVVE